MSAFGLKLRTREGGVIAFWCPGCKESHGVGINSGAAGRSWTFNDNPEAPTFSPSVLVTMRGDPEEGIDQEICHSFVSDGRIQFLSDCTHELAGQTVPLPDYPGNAEELAS